VTELEQQAMEPEREIPIGDSPTKEYKNVE
jgi:hypothetical protein